MATQYAADGCLKMPKLLTRPAATTARQPPRGINAPDPRRAQSFEIYRALGPGRTYQKLMAAVSVRLAGQPGFARCDRQMGEEEWLARTCRSVRQWLESGRAASAAIPTSRPSDCQSTSRDDRDGDEPAVCFIDRGLRVSITVLSDRCLAGGAEVKTRYRSTLCRYLVQYRTAPGAPVKVRLAGICLSHQRRRPMGFWSLVGRALSGSNRKPRSDCRARTNTAIWKYTGRRLRKSVLYI
jgi:hypothetical protein